MILLSIKDDARFLANDSYLYKESALTILTSGTFSLSRENPEIPLLIRTPGYPIFIAIIYTIFGQKDIALVIANIILSCLSIILINKILNNLISKEATSIGTFLYAFEPLSISLIYYVLPQIFFQFLLFLIIMYSLKLLRINFSIKNWILFGFSLAITSIVKPVSFYLICPLIIGVIFFLYKNKIKFLIITKYLTIISIPLIIVLGGWLYRNYLITGNFIISHIQALDLFYFKAPAVLSIKENITFEEARVVIAGERDIWPWILKNPRSSEIKELERTSKNILFDNPLITGGIIIKGIINTLFSPGDGQFYSVLGKGHIRAGPLGDFFRLSIIDFYKKWILKEPFLIVLFILFSTYLILIYGGIASYVINYWNSNPEIWIHYFLTLSLLYFIIVSGGLETYYRFRNPMIPFLLILSAQGWEHILLKIKNIK